MKKAKEGDFNFASRAQKIDKLEFPQSTEERFIVKANKDVLFDFLLYLRESDSNGKHMMKNYWLEI